MSFRIGVDGGGTKTELILVDPAGAVVDRLAAAGCNPSHVGPAAARTILAEALDRLRGGRTIGRVLLFMAGNTDFWRETAAGLEGFGAVSAAPDAEPVVELALDGGVGLALHAGTGSFVAARTSDGRIHYAGGLGWRLGDPGSAHDLGRRGIAAGLLELQGWAPPTALGPALRDHFGLADAREMVRQLYHEARMPAQIPLFAPRVMELAAGGCAPAAAALADSLGGMVALAKSVSDRLFGGARTRCGVSGALLNRPLAKAELARLAAAAGWPADFVFVTDPPIEGVRRLLLAAR